MGEWTAQDDRNFFVIDARQAIVGFYDCVVEAMAAMRARGVGARVVRLSDGEVIGYQPRSARDWGRA